MALDVTDVWFRTDLPLAEIGRRLGLRDLIEDCENHWQWVIGAFGGVQLDICRTHTRPPADVDTRVFVLDGGFTEPLLAEVVGRLRAFVPGPVACGRWRYLSGNDYDLVPVRVFGPTTSATDGPGHGR